MGAIRNGARTFLNALRLACKMSRMDGFVPGLQKILGPERATDVLTVWVPLCEVVDTLVALDNYFNQIDTVAESTGDEDLTEEV